MNEHVLIFNLFIIYQFLQCYGSSSIFETLNFEIIASFQFPCFVKSTKTMVNKNYHPTLVTYNKLGLNIILKLCINMNMNDDMKCVKKIQMELYPYLKLETQ